MSICSHLILLGISLAAFINIHTDFPSKQLYNILEKLRPKMLQNVNIKLTVLKDIYYREQKDVLVVANKENKRYFIIFFFKCHIF